MKKNQKGRQREDIRHRRREQAERDWHHACIADCPACGARMRRRLDGTWWHSPADAKGECELLREQKVTP